MPQFDENQRTAVGNKLDSGLRLPFFGTQPETRDLAHAAIWSPSRANAKLRVVSLTPPGRYHSFP